MYHVAVSSLPHKVPLTWLPERLDLTGGLSTAVVFSARMLAGLRAVRGMTCVGYHSNR